MSQGETGILPDQSSPGLSAEERAQLRLLDVRICDCICDTINFKLTRFQSAAGPPWTFDKSARELFLQAWMIAAQLRSRAVEIDHIVVALSLDGMSDDFAKIAGSHPTAPIAGALVRIASLEAASVQSAPVDKLLLSDNVAKWVNAAARNAAGGAIGRAHLVEALKGAGDDRAVAQMVQRQVKDAARVGRTQSELTMMRKNIASLGKTTSFFRADARGKFATLSDQMTGMEAAISDLKAKAELVAPELAKLAAPLASVEQATACTAALVPALAKSIEASRGALADLCRGDGEVRAAVDARMEELKRAIEDCRDGLAALQRPATESKSATKPSAPWLAGAIVAVIALGTALGVVISKASPRETPSPSQEQR